MFIYLLMNYQFLRIIVDTNISNRMKTRWQPNSPSTILSSYQNSNSRFEITKYSKRNFYHLIKTFL